MAAFIFIKSGPKGGRVLAKEKIRLEKGETPPNGLHKLTAKDRRLQKRLEGRRSRMQAADSK